MQPSIGLRLGRTAYTLLEQLWEFVLTFGIIITIAVAVAVIIVYGAKPVFLGLPQNVQLWLTLTFFGSLVAGWVYEVIVTDIIHSVRDAWRESKLD